MIYDGSGKRETVDHQEEANSETFVMGSDAAEFVNKVNDQVRSRQKRTSNVAESGKSIQQYGECSWPREVTEFVNKVRDQVRIRQKRMSSIAENCTEHS